MALKLNKIVNGVTCEYWKVVEIIGDAYSDSTRVVVASYVNEEVRRQSVNNIIGNPLNIYIPQFGLSLTDIYTYIKGELIDAQDC